MTELERVRYALTAVLENQRLMLSGLSALVVVHDAESDLAARLAGRAEATEQMIKVLRS